MKFQVGPMPSDSGFDESRYVELKMPRGSTLQLASSILFVTFLVGTIWFWNECVAVAWPDSNWNVVAQAVIATILVIPVHELLHALTYPKDSTHRVVVGFWPDMGAFYAVFSGEVSRNRSIVVGLSPFILLSLTPMIYASSVASAPSWLALVSIINTSLSGADALALCCLIKQAPRRSKIQFNGAQAYWRRQA